MKSKNNILTILALLLIPIIMQGKESTMLFCDGRSNYKIVVSENASVAEKTAAEELQSYLYKTSGITLPITNDMETTGNAIVIGYNILSSKATGKPCPDQNDEGFTLLTQDNNLYIFGGAQRGTMYGVFAFLEQEMGIHWFTKDFTAIPRHHTLALPQLNQTEQPAFIYRELLYFGLDSAWKAHNRINAANSIEPNIKYGDLNGIWGFHTIDQLISADEYFTSHPEYFSLYHGKRQRAGQLCFSNPHVIKICGDKLTKIMTDYPMFQAYSVTQMDNSMFCQCRQCMSIEQRYGGHAGLILWFVNQVGNITKKNHPNKQILTFAYDSTRKPPANIYPDDHITIRLCNNDACFSHPLESECNHNLRFMKDLKRWSTMANNLYVLDYVSTFGIYLIPFPNFQVLAPNLRTLAKHKVKGVTELGQYQSIGGDFAEMKSWILAKLMWNPYQDTDSLAYIFCQGYYGKAANSILDYYHLYKTLVTPTAHADLRLSHYYDLYTADFTRRGMRLLDQAIAAVKDDTTVTNRVNLIRTPFLYMKSFRYKEESENDGSYETLIKLVQKYQPYIGENFPAYRFPASRPFE